MNLKRCTVFFVTLLFFYHQTGFSQPIDGQMTVDGLVRTYHLYIPKIKKPTGGFPLVIMLHGGGGSGADMMRFTHFNDLADADTFLVVYPDGDHRSWNDRRIGGNLPSQANDVKFISLLIDEMVANHDADPKRVFATGISNGAIMCYFLAQELSDKLLAIAPVCGSIPQNYFSTYHISHPLSVMAINGTGDPLVPYEGGPVLSKRSDRGIVSPTDSVIKKLVGIEGCNDSPSQQSLPDIDARDRCHAVEYTYHDCSANCQVVLIKVINGGHTWPGGIQYLPKGVIGRVCRDFDASSVIWQFFSQQVPR